MRKLLSHFENWTTIIALTVVVGVAFGNVISRYVLGTSFAFTSELTVNLAVYVAIVGSVIALRENSHLGFSLLPDSANGKVRKRILVFTGIAIGSFYAVIAYYSFNLALSQAQRGTVTPALGVPDFLYTSAMVVGGVLGVIRAVEIIVDRVKAPALSHAEEVRG